AHAHGAQAPACGIGGRQDMTSAADEIDGAIAWYERINAPDADETTWSEFTVWLEADAKNREAFDRIEALHGELDTNAHALGRGAQVIRFPRRHGPRTGARRLAGAGVLAAPLLIDVYFFMSGAGAGTYATPV